MPYIKEHQKESLAIETPGQLNYDIHLIIDSYIQEKGGDKYQTHNDIMGVLECVKQEFYRRMTAPLEDIKIDENGDVPPYSNSTLCNPCPGSFPEPPAGGADVWDQLYHQDIVLPDSEKKEYAQDYWDPEPETEQQFDLPEVSGPLDFDRGKKNDIWVREPATDPHDGTLGWWRVDGLRHSAIVSALSAQGAIDRADADEHVDKSWEMPMVTWIGERLPNSIRC